MKKLLILTAALITALSFYSCKDDDPDLIYKLEVDKTSLTFAPDATEVQTITVTSENVIWTAEINSEAAEWLTVTTTGSTISVSVTIWRQSEARTGTITVKPDTDKVAAKTVTVTQSAVDNPDEPDDPDAKIAELGILYFYGDYFGIGAGNYLLYLVTGEYEIDGGEIYVINGSVITLDMIADEVTKEEVRADGAELPIGTYTCSSNYERMSFIKASYDEEYDYYEGSIIENYANGEYTDLYAIVGGTVDVQKSGDVYKITMNFEYEDGTTETVVFNDEMSSAMNYSSNSTYKEDITITGLSEGDLTFYSYMYDPNCYTWDVRMSTPGLIDANDEYGTGTEILLTLQSPTTSTTVLDNGTYTFDYSYGRFTAVPGSVFWVFPVDSWVFEYENGDWVNYSPIVSGLVTVTATDAANGVYSITLDGEGDNYYEIKTTYSGALTYIDYSGDSETGAVQNRFAKKNETDPRYVLKQKKSGGIFRGR